MSTGIDPVTGRPFAEIEAEEEGAFPTRIIVAGETVPVDGRLTLPPPEVDVLAIVDAQATEAAVEAFDESMRADDAPTAELARPVEWDESQRISPVPTPAYPPAPHTLYCAHEYPLNGENPCPTCAAARRREMMTDGQRAVEDLIDEFTAAAARGETVDFFTRLVAQRMRWSTWERERKELEDEIRDLRRVVRDLNRTYRPMDREVGDPVEASTAEPPAPGLAEPSYTYVFRGR